MSKLTNKSHFMMMLVAVTAAAFGRYAEGTGPKSLDVHTEKDESLTATPSSMKYDGDKVDVIGPAKYDVWKEAGDTPKAQAEEYVKCHGDEIYEKYMDKDSQ